MMDSIATTTTTVTATGTTISTSSDTTTTTTTNSTVYVYYLLDTPYYYTSFCREMLEKIINLKRNLIFRVCNHLAI